jgi:hypothetical protein
MNGQRLRRLRSTGVLGQSNRAATVKILDDSLFTWTTLQGNVGLRCLSSKVKKGSVYFARKFAITQQTGNICTKVSTSTMVLYDSTIR